MRNGWMQRIAGCCLPLMMGVTALAQDTSQNAPVLNAIGRFWGFGYSQGYHACNDGRLGWGLARDFHISPTPDPELTSIYSAQYQPWQPGHHVGQVAWPAGPAMNSMSLGAMPGNAFSGMPVPSKLSPQRGAGPSRPATTPASPNKPVSEDNDKSPSDRNTAPPRPSTPPPEWLKRYLPQDETGGAVLLNDLESVEKPSTAKPTPSGNRSPSTPADDDLLIPKESSDDLLTPLKSSRATRPAPIHHVPAKSQSTSRTAGTQGSIWIGPSSAVTQPQRR